MAVNLKRAFKSLVEGANWMDVTTKATAKEKVLIKKSNCKFVFNEQTSINNLYYF